MCAKGVRTCPAPVERGLVMLRRLRRHALLGLAVWPLGLYPAGKLAHTGPSLQQGL